MPSDDLTRHVLAVLKLPPRRAVPHYRLLRPLRGRKYPKRYATVYAVDSEHGICVIAYMLTDRPYYAQVPAGPEPATIYVAPWSSDEELKGTEFVRKRLLESNLPFAVDRRGIGEWQPKTCRLNSYTHPYGCHYFYAADAIMLDYPAVAQRVHDLLCLFDVLGSRGHRQVSPIGYGQGSLPAALIDDRASRVVLNGYLPSYRSVAECDLYNWPLPSLLPDVLPLFDLPDV